MFVHTLSINNVDQFVDKKGPCSVTSMKIIWPFFNNLMKSLGTVDRDSSYPLLFNDIRSKQNIFHPVVLIDFGNIQFNYLEFKARWEFINTFPGIIIFLYINTYIERGKEIDPTWAGCLINCAAKVKTL